MPQRIATAQWNGPITEGEGTVALGSGAFEGRYSFSSRFEEGSGTNPEELLGAAHAGCFSMALAGALGAAGHTPTSIRTEARVTVSPADGGFRIPRIVLVSTASVPGIEAAEFAQIADEAKRTCPVSVALGGVDEIELQATLEG